MTILDNTTRSNTSVATRRSAARRPNVIVAGCSTAQGWRNFSADAAAAVSSGSVFVAAVADGIADTPGAAAAAWIAANAATAGVRAEARDVLRAAQGALRAAQEVDHGIGDAVLAVAAGDAGRGWSVSWVGDCRAYFVPLSPSASQETGPALRLTSDHTVAEYLRARGIHPGAGFEHLVTSTVATAGREDVGHILGPPGPGAVVLVSDGVHRLLDALTIALIVRTAADPVAAAEHLTGRALAAGSQDNVAAVVTSLP